MRLDSPCLPTGQSISELSVVIWKHPCEHHVQAIVPSGVITSYYSHKFQGQISVRFSCSCLTLCDPMDWSLSGFAVHNQLPELAQTHVHRVSDAIQPSHPRLPLLFLSSVLPIPVSQFFPSGGQTIGISASASVLPMNIQDWFPLGWTGLTPCSPRDSQEFSSNTTVQKHQFFSAQFSLWYISHICTWLLEKPQLWLRGLCRQSDASAF